jgi:hypothetical protein
MTECFRLNGIQLLALPSEKNETLGSISGGEFLHQMSYCQLLKEDNAPCYYSTQRKFFNLFTKIKT